MTTRITSNLALAGLLIAVSLGLAFLRRHGVVGAEEATRGAMVLTGILLAVYGNVIPKSLSRLSARGNPFSVSPAGQPSSRELAMPQSGHSPQSR